MTAEGLADAMTRCKAGTGQPEATQEPCQRTDRTGEPQLTGVPAFLRDSAEIPAKAGKVRLQNTRISGTAPATPKAIP